MAKKQEIKVGTLVAFNTLPDAAWFEVLEVNGFLLTIKEYGTEYASQTMDKSFVKQIKN